MTTEYTDWETETYQQKQDRLRLLPFRGATINLIDNSGKTSDDEYDLLHILPHSIGDHITSHDQTYKIVEIDWCLDNQRQYVTAHKVKR